MKLIIFIMTIWSLFLTASCQAQSKMPVKMPENVSFSLFEGGGMSRSYTKITIENEVIKYEELVDNQSEVQKWTANISAEETEKLYQTFVDNAFDVIKNDKRKEIVYDAGSETISISFAKLKSYNVTYGKNSPLSGRNLRHYEAVRKAIIELVEKAKNQLKDDFPVKTVDEAEKFLQGKWRAAGDHGNGHAWFLEWTFDGGKFKQIGYPPLSQEGAYKIISVQNGAITVELFEQKGTFGGKTETVEIIIDSETKQLTIFRVKGFSRVVA